MIMVHQKHLFPKIRTVALGAVIALLLGLLGCVAPRDVDRNRPEDVARRFVELARAKDYEKAAAC